MGFTTRKHYIDLLFKIIAATGTKLEIHAA